MRKNALQLFFFHLKKNNSDEEFGCGIVEITLCGTRTVTGRSAGPRRCRRTESRPNDPDTYGQCGCVRYRCVYLTCRECERVGIILLVDSVIAGGIDSPDGDISREIGLDQEQPFAVNDNQKQMKKIEYKPNNELISLRDSHAQIALKY